MCDTHIYDSITRYIYDSITFESYNVVQETLTKIKNSSNFDDILKYPIHDRIFNYVESIKWLFFLYNLSITLQKNNIYVVLNIKDAMDYIINTFSLIKEDLDEYFESKHIQE